MSGGGKDKNKDQGSHRPAKEEVSHEERTAPSRGPNRQGSTRDKEIWESTDWDRPRPPKDPKKG